MLSTCSSSVSQIFFFNDTATTEIYTLSLHDALPIFPRQREAEESDPDHARRNDRQHHMGKALPGRCSKVPRGLLEAMIEPVEDRKRDQRAERHAPGKLGPEAGWVDPLAVADGAAPTRP